MNWHDYFTYDAETGNLTWKERPRELFKSQRSWKIWNRRYAGQVAGSPRTRRAGHRHGVMLSIHNKHKWAHRIIWEMHRGDVATGMEIDHKDGNPWNNRLDNLRTATRTQNAYNAPIQRNNTSGYKGVSRCKKGRMNWQVCMKVRGKMKAIGRYVTLEEAVAARQAAAEALHGEFVRH